MDVQRPFEVQVMHVKEADSVQSGYVQIHGEINLVWHFPVRPFKH